MTHIDVLNRKLLIDEQHSIGLTSGKMGMCIYFYYLSRWEVKEKHKQVAEKLLDEVINNLTNKMDFSVENGLAGIAIGISHLVREKFVEGDINEILEEVDSRIFKVLAFLKQEDSKFSKQVLIHLLYYLYVRYIEQKSFGNKYIFQELIIKTVEIIYHNLPADFFHEHFSFSFTNYKSPLFLFILSKLYDLNIYNDRLDRILEEFIGPILSVIPILHANRLYLLNGLLSIKPYLLKYKNEIISRIHLIKERINIEHIMNVELKNQDIYIKNGLSFIYILLFFIQIKHPEYKIDYDPQTFFNRITNSKAWNTLLSSDYYQKKHDGLFNGFPGAHLVLVHIKNNFL